MRLKGIWILGAIALGALAFVGAGCGGSAKTTTVTVDSSTVESTDTDTTAMEAETTTDETDTSATDTDAMGMETDAMSTDAMGTDAMSETTDAPDVSSFASSENCQQFVNFATDLSAAMSGTGNTDLQAAADTLQKYADEAPDEIKDDFQALADAYSKIADAFDGVDLNSTEPPPADVLAKIASITSSIDSAKLAQAGANISAWTTQNCTGG
jgi:hypothetical protein